MMARKNLCLNENLIFFINEYGIKKSSSWISCALGEMGFSYEHSTMNGLSANFYILFERFINLFDNSVKEESIDFPTLLTELYQYKRLLIWVDNYFIEGSPYYCKEHYDTIMVLLKIDKLHTTLYDNGYKTIPTKIFFKATNSRKRISCYHCFDLNFKYDEKSIISMGIQQITDNLSLKGAEGIQRILVYINDVINNYDPEYLYKQYFQMKRPGGTSLSRYDMSKFLFEQSEMKLSSRYYELSEKWRTAGNLIFKLSTRPENDDLRNRIKQHLDDIYSCEVDNIEMLLKNKTWR